MADNRTAGIIFFIFCCIVSIGVMYGASQRYEKEEAADNAVRQQVLQAQSNAVNAQKNAMMSLENDQAIMSYIGDLNRRVGAIESKPAVAPTATYKPTAFCVAHESSDGGYVLACKEQPVYSYSE